MGFLRDTIVTELDNGIRLCCFHRRGSSVELQLHVATGSMHEKEFLGCGLSHFLEHMAFQGCAGFSGRAIADEVNSLGGDVNAYTSYDRTCYRMQLPKESWRQGVSMLSAMVRFPEFPEERFLAEKEVILRECERGNDDISRRLHEKFLRTMFLRHPVRFPIIGFKDMISGVTRDMMMEYYSRRYTPGRCIFVAVGDLSAGDFFDSVSAALGDWQASHLFEESLGSEDLPSATRESELIFSDPLERLFWGVRIPGFGSAELPALELLFGVLGSGDGSILNGNLVLDKQLALGVRSFCYSLGNVSLAGISAKAEPGKMKRLQSALTGELEKVASGKIQRAHLEREKGQQYADHLREFRDITYVAGEIAGGMLHDNTPDAGDKFLETLQHTGVDEIKRVAEKFLDQQHWVHIHQHNHSRSVSGKSDAASVKLELLEQNSGSKIVFAPDNQLPLCNFFMVLPGGALFEPAGRSGITKLLAQTLPSGGGKYDENAFLRELDAAGVLLDVSAGANSLIVEFSAPRRKMARAVAAVAQMLGAPRFDEKVIEREKQRLIESINERNFIPGKIAGDMAFKLLYGKHPYAVSRCGKAEDIAAVSRDELLDFYHQCTGSGRIYGFGGDCSAEEAEKFAAILDQAMNGDAKGFSLPELPEFPAAVQRQTVALDREQTVVLRLLPGLESAADASEMLDIFEILHQAENGLASTLFKSVREEHALSYAVGMSFTAGFHPGTISFYAMTAAGAENEVLELLNAEISRLASTGLSEEEFSSALAGVIFDAEKNLDSVESLLRAAVMDAYYGRSPLDVLSRPERLAGIKYDEFNARIASYFSKPGGVEMVVLPEEKNECKK